MLSSISRCRYWATDTQYARELAGGRREEHHIPERSRRRRQFRFSSKWRRRKATSGGFSLLAPDAGLTRWDYCEPHRTGGNFKKIGRGPTYPLLPSLWFLCKSVRCLLPVSSRGRSWPRSEKCPRPSYLFVLATSRAGAYGTKSPGARPHVGHRVPQRVAFPLSPAAPHAATTAQRWEYRGGNTGAAIP